MIRETDLLKGQSMSYTEELEVPSNHRQLVAQDVMKLDLR